MKLGDVATYVNGYPFQPAEWSDHGVPIIRIQDLTGNSYQTNLFSGTIDERYKIHTGDILISWSASLGVYVWQRGDAVLNQHIFKVVFNKSNVDKTFFVHQVRNLLRKSASAAHGATMKHLTKPVFDSLPFFLPSDSEQKHIAAILDHVSKAIALHELLIQKQDQLAKSRFIEMFGDPVSNSQHWPMSHLNDLGTISRGVSKNRPRNAPELLGGIYPLIQTGDVANAETYLTAHFSTYSELGLKQSKMWPTGTLCITIAANIAKTAILTFDACFPDSVVGFLSNDKTNQLFVHYWFSFFQKILEEQAPESAQKNINMQILQNLDVICPPLSLQNEFASFIAHLDKSKVTIRQSLEKLNLAYRALLQEYFG